MSASMSNKTPDRLWLCMADSPRTRTLSRALAKGMDVTVYLGSTVDPDGPIALIIVDDANLTCLETARANAAPHQKSILVTVSPKRIVAADIFLTQDCDAGTLANVIEGLFAYRASQISPAASQTNPVMTTLDTASFRLRTLEEAVQAALFLGAMAPRVCETTVGLYVLMANGIEHGNLDFSTEDKAQGLASGNWARKLAQRMAEPEYHARRVNVDFQRGERLISLLIQDDGDGIDAETAELANPLRVGHRGRGIKLAKSMGFAELTWLGIGNTLAASILLPARQDETVRSTATVS
ncbi:hypothetical protein [uncultured Maricaulis sp.]|uniref:hypothetical protein n=1 Tax=uncultured Maricaulis sp. TaxID=174710 RepID=UPI0030D7451F|tara:strand:+ start:79555 stop:80442 length:888 start_codon:yes stop_codon:yes gene_type:complete